MERVSLRRAMRTACTPPNAFFNAPAFEHS